MTISRPYTPTVGESTNEPKESKFGADKSKLGRMALESQNFTKSSEGKDRIAPFMEELQNTYTSMRIQKRKKMMILEKIRKNNSHKRMAYRHGINQETRCTSLD